jgi:hypothetical protein
MVAACESDFQTALRSFVEGIQSASFAEAADRLCRSTSAVSAQLKNWALTAEVDRHSLSAASAKLADWIPSTKLRSASRVQD